MIRPSRIILSTAIGMFVFSGSAYALDPASGTISTSGPGSRNNISIKESCDIDVTNINNIEVSADNQQTAHSGGAKSSFNTNGGNSQSGMATNTNTSATDIDISSSPRPENSCNSTPTGVSQPNMPGRGNGGPQFLTAATPSATPGPQQKPSTTGTGGKGATTPQPSGASTAKPQVQAPQGGVNTGAGGIAPFILYGSMLSGLFGVRRLRAN